MADDQLDILPVSQPTGSESISADPLDQDSLVRNQPPCDTQNSATTDNDENETFAEHSELRVNRIDSQGESGSMESHEQGVFIADAPEPGDAEAMLSKALNVELPDTEDENEVPLGETSDVISVRQILERAQSDREAHLVRVIKGAVLTASQVQSSNGQGQAGQVQSSNGQGQASQVRSRNGQGQASQVQSSHGQGQARQAQSSNGQGRSEPHLQTADSLGGPLGNGNAMGPEESNARGMYTGVEREPYLARAHPGSPQSAGVQEPAWSHCRDQQQGDEMQQGKAGSTNVGQLFQRTGGVGARSPMLSRPYQVHAETPEPARKERETSHPESAISHSCDMVSEVGYAEALQSGGSSSKRRHARSAISGTSSNRSQPSSKQLSANQKCGSYVSSLPGSATGTPETNAPDWSKERSALEPRAPELKGLSKRDIAHETISKKSRQGSRRQVDDQSVSGSDSRLDGEEASNGSELTPDDSLLGAKKSKRKGSFGSRHSERPSRSRSRRSSGMSASLVGSTARTSVTGLSRSASQRTTASQQQQLINKYFESMDGRLTDKDARVKMAENQIAREKETAQERIAREKETAQERIDREAKIAENQIKMAENQIAREKETAQERIDRETKIAENQMKMARDLLDREKATASEKQKLVEQTAQERINKETALAQTQVQVAQEKEKAAMNAKEALRMDRSRERRQMDEQRLKYRQTEEAQRKSMEKMMEAYTEQHREATSLLKAQYAKLQQQKEQETNDLQRREVELNRQLTVVKHELEEFRLQLHQKLQEQGHHTAQQLSRTEDSRRKTNESRESARVAQQNLEGVERRMAMVRDPSPATIEQHRICAAEASRTRREWQESTKHRQDQENQTAHSNQQYTDAVEEMQLKVALKESEKEQTQRDIRECRSRSCSQNDNRSSSFPAWTEKGVRKAKHGREDLRKGVRFEDAVSESSGSEERRSASRSCAEVPRSGLKATHDETGIKQLEVEESVRNRLQPGLPSSTGVSGGTNRESPIANSPVETRTSRRSQAGRRSSKGVENEQTAMMEKEAELQFVLAQLSRERVQHADTVKKLSQKPDEFTRAALMDTQQVLETRQLDILTKLRQDLVGGQQRLEEEVRQVKVTQETLGNRLEAIDGKLTPPGANSPNGRQSPRKLSLPPGRPIENELSSSEEDSPPSEYSGGNLSIAKLSLATDVPQVIVNNHAKVNLSSLKEYDGEGNFKTWLISFERQLSLYGQIKTDEEKAKYLPIRFTGMALEYFNSLPQNEQKSYQKAVLALTNAFSSMARLESTKWMRMGQRPHESIMSFATRIKHAQREATGDQYDTDQMQDWSMKCFIEGLRPDIRLKMHECNPSTWKEVIENAKYYERALARSDGDHPRSALQRPFQREPRLHAITEMDDPLDFAPDMEPESEEWVSRSEFETMQREFAALKMDKNKPPKQKKQQKMVNVNAIDNYARPNEQNSYPVNRYNQAQQDAAVLKLGTPPQNQKPYVPPQARPENQQGTTTPILTQEYTQSTQGGGTWVPEKAWRKRVGTAQEYNRTGNVGGGGNRGRPYTGLSSDRWEGGLPVCNYCNAIGHIARECSILPPQGQEEQRKKREDEKRERQKGAQVAPVSKNTQIAAFSLEKQVAPLSHEMRPTTSSDYPEDTDDVICESSFDQSDEEIQEGLIRESPPASGAADQEGAAREALLDREVEKDEDVEGLTPTRFRPTGSRMYVEIKVNDTAVFAMVDTGAEATVMDEKFAEKCVDPAMWQRNNIKCTSASGHIMPFIATAAVNITIGNVTREHVVFIAKNLFRKMVLGDEFFARLNVDVTYRRKNGTTKRQMFINSKPIITRTGSSPRGEHSLCEIAFAADCEIPPRTVSDITFRVIKPGKVSLDVKDGATVLIEPIDQGSSELYIPRVLTKVWNGKVTMPIMNVANVTLALPSKDFSVKLERYEQPVGEIAGAEPSIPKGVTKPKEMAKLQSVKITGIMRIVEKRMASKDPTPMIPGLDMTKSDLSEEQKRRYLFALDCIRQVFAKDDTDLGLTNLVKHDIDTGDAIPIRQQAYRTAFQKRPEMDQLLDIMLTTGVIEPANSPWASPVVLVKKKDGKLRFCVDYRKVNAVTRKDSYPMPRIDELLDALSGGTFFTTIDLQSGFWQIPMTKEASRKTTFICHRGSFSFTKMPFGLTAAPGTFQRLMDCILAGLTGFICLVFLDDVIIYTQTTVEQHLEDVLKVLIALAYYGLKVKGKKCHIAKKELQFLGHIVSAQGIQPDPEKISVIKDCTPPKDQHDLRVFLGLVGFYRKFIMRCARVAAPLTKLLQKEVEYQWTDGCQEAFETLKKQLTEAPILAYPDLQKPYVLYTDASGLGIGCVLEQEGKDGRMHVVAYASRALKKHEKNYSTTDWELLAIIWGMHYFRPYLLGSQTKIITDHQPNHWILQKNTPRAKVSSRHNRWAIAMQEFDYTIEYKAGRKHKNADALSRPPVVPRPEGIDSREWDPNDWQQTEEGTEDIGIGVQPVEIEKVTTTPDQIEISEEIVETEVQNAGASAVEVTQPSASVADDSVDPEGDEAKRALEFVAIELIQIPNLSHRDAREMQMDDPYCKAFIDYKEGLPLTDDARLRIEVVQASPFFTISDGVLRHIVKRRKENAPEPGPARGEQLVVPQRMQTPLIAAYHSGQFAGHFGHEKVFQTLARKYFWRGMYDDIREHCKSCLTCAEYNEGERRKARLYPSDVTMPFHRVIVDFEGPLPETPRGNKYILVYIDSFTKWPICVATKDLTAETAAQSLLDDVIMQHGVPYEILSDNGPAFASDLYRRFCEKVGIKKTYSTPHHPQTVGQVENLNKTVLAILRKKVQLDEEDWDLKLKYTVFAIRSTFQLALRDSPFHALYGRDATLPHDLLVLPMRKLEENEHTARFQKQMKNAWDYVRGNLLVAGARMKHYYDKHVTDDRVQVGDVVLKTDQVQSGRRRKLAPSFVGYYRVSAVNPPNVVLQKIGGRTVDQETVHENRVKVYRGELLPPAITMESKRIARGKKASERKNRSCYLCGQDEPPDQGEGIIRWALCDLCEEWFHCYCVNLRREPKAPHWYCPECRARTTPQEREALRVVAPQPKRRVARDVAEAANAEESDPSDAEDGDPTEPEQSDEEPPSDDELGHDFNEPSASTSWVIEGFPLFEDSENEDPNGSDESASEESHPADQ